MVRDLCPFLEPDSVAVVGAGERASSSGGAVMRNLDIAGYDGRLVPVNPKGGMMFGREAVTSLRALDHAVDLVVIVIRPDLIQDAVEEAVATGHRNLLILPGGFAESGADGQARDKALRAFAETHGVTIAGPNCAGTIHLGRRRRFAASFLRDLPPGGSPAGALAFVSQSGALAEEVIAASHRMSLPFGTVVSVGNAMHLGVEDYLAHLGDEKAISAILLYIESIADRARFRAIAQRVARVKPVVALMSGATVPGARATAAHTGAVPTDEAAIEAYLAECGIVRATSLRRLLLAAKIFGAYPEGIGPRALILSNSGGPGVLATDQAIREGLELPGLPETYAATLRQALPGEASVANPLDLLADAREERFGLTLDGALTHGKGAFDAILMIHVVPFMVEAGPIVASLAERAEENRVAGGPPILHAMMGTLPDKVAWFGRMGEAGVPCFDDVEAMAEAAGMAARLRRLRASLPPD